jgi:hypothetical protein
VRLVHLVVAGGIRKNSATEVGGAAPEAEYTLICATQ